MSVLGRIGQFLSSRRDGEAAVATGGTERDATGTLVVTLADGSTAFFDETEWVAGPDRVWVTSVSKDGFTHGNRLQNPPTAVHVPVKGMVAADNRWNKTEHDARVQRSVTRYAKVVNPSDNPFNRVELDVPYLELHYE